MQLSISHKRIQSLTKCPCAVAVMWKHDKGMDICTCAVTISCKQAQSLGKCPCAVTMTRKHARRSWKRAHAQWPWLSNILRSRDVSANRYLHTGTYIIDKCSCPIYTIGRCETSTAKLTSINTVTDEDLRGRNVLHDHPLTAMWLLNTCPDPKINFI